jgi:hypothetical protein
MGEGANRRRQLINTPPSFSASQRQKVLDVDRATAADIQPAPTKRTLAQGLKTYTVIFSPCNET